MMYVNKELKGTSTVIERVMTSNRDIWDERLGWLDEFILISSIKTICLGIVTNTDISFKID